MRSLYVDQGGRPRQFWKVLLRPLHCKRLNLCYFGLELILLSKLSNHWIVMLTYLHHSDPTIAHYRNKQWSFLRGAISTVDRPLLGWAGRFFLHNVSHDHVCHFHLLFTALMCLQKYFRSRTICSLPSPSVS